MGAGGHDDLVGAFLVQVCGAGDFKQLVARQVGQVIQRLDAVFTEGDEVFGIEQPDIGDFVADAQAMRWASFARSVFRIGSIVISLLNNSAGCASVERRVMIFI